jgi:hypothetical protein
VVRKRSLKKIAKNLIEKNFYKFLNQIQASLIRCQCDVGWVSYEDTKCLKAIVSQTMISWNEFNYTCTTEFGGTMASIHSIAENKFIFNSFLQPNDVLDSNMCIGGKRKIKNEFIWVDGTPYNFTNWGQQVVQPDGDGDCMEMWSTAFSNEKAVPNDKGKSFKENFFV